MRDFVNETVSAEGLYALIDEVARHPERAGAVKHRIRAGLAPVATARAPVAQDEDDPEDLWDNVPI